MTRVYVYAISLGAFVAATAMIIASIQIPHWVIYSVTTPQGQTFEKHIGLHKSCSTLSDPHCQTFPDYDMCADGQRYFCSMWKTVGFLANFVTILCLACLMAFVIIMSGGKYKRETAWPFVSVMLTLVAAVELSLISIVAYLYDNDEQFLIPGWHLDVSWYMSTVSGSICLLTAAGLVSSAYLLPAEDGYDFLEDPAMA